MREQKLLELINDNEVFYITDSDDMRYYAGFTGEGAVVLGHGEKVILTDGRYTEKARQESEYCVAECINHFKYLNELNKKIIIQPNSITYRKFKLYSDNGLELVTKDIDFDALRSVKDDEEIDCLKKAASIAEKSLESLLEYIKPGVSEKELSAKLNYFMAINGSEKESFDTILISGKKTSLPHGVPSDKKIENGDFVTIDFGCKFNGYCSDMTRTFAVGFATDEMKNVYNVVLNAQETAQKFVMQGKKLNEIDFAARDIIKNAGYGNYFVHSLGHGVGLKIHELPNLGPRCVGELIKNNVVTVEPGIYIPGKFGVRIENTVIVNENKCESLQNFTKELIIL